MMTIHPTRRLVRSAPTLAAVLVLVLAACAAGDDSASSGEAEPSPARIEIQGFAFMPAEYPVPAGTTVTFVNRDSAPHTVTHGTDGVATDGAAFDEALPAGGEVTITFDEVGTFPITCTIHPSMNMTVVVEG